MSEVIATLGLKFQRLMDLRWQEWAIRARGAGPERQYLEAMKAERQILGDEIQSLRWKALYAAVRCGIPMPTAEARVGSVCYHAAAMAEWVYQEPADGNGTGQDVRKAIEDLQGLYVTCVALGPPPLSPGRPTPGAE